MNNKIKAWLESGQKPYRDRNALGKVWYIIRWPFFAVILILAVLYIGLRIFATWLLNMIFDNRK